MRGLNVVALSRTDPQVVPGRRLRRVAPVAAAVLGAAALGSGAWMLHAPSAPPRYAYAWDWSGAQADFHRALAREPGDSTHWRRYADLLAATGRLREAIAAGRNATALDPLSAPAWGNLGMYLAAHGDHTDAEHALRRALDLAPDSPFALNGLATLQLIEGHAEAARALFQRISLEGFRLTGTAMAEHSLGHTRESRTALDEALARIAEGWAYQIAETYAWRGENERALEWLERACTQHDAGVTAILADPLLHAVRTGPRYQALVRRLNLLHITDEAVGAAPRMTPAKWPADAASQATHTTLVSDAPR